MRVDVAVDQFETHVRDLEEIASLLSSARQRISDLAQSLAIEAANLAKCRALQAAQGQVKNSSLPPIIESDALMSFADTARFLGLARQTIWAMRRAGNFPEPIKLSTRRRAFRAADIGRWLNENRS